LSTIGQTLQRIRKSRGLSRYALGRRAGVAHSFIAAIEDGQKSPTFRTLEKLAGALGVSVAELVGDSGGSLADEGV
jgi:transcriptional regulator with XRE-family HTH domain